MLTTKILLRILLNTFIGVILILIWLKFVDIKQILLTLSKVNLLSLIPVFLFMLLSPTLRALRLKVFLSEVKKINLLDLIYLNGAAMMLNFFIPVRAGEIVKGVYLNTRYNLHLGKSIVWIFIDRFVDFLVVLLLTGFLLMIIPTNLTKSFALTISLIFIAFLVITYLAVFQIKLSRKIVIFLKYILIEKHIKIYFDRFSKFILSSFSILDRHPKDLFLMILITILAYGADAFIWYFIFISLGQSQDYLKMYLGQILSALTYLIPAAPGYVGSAEASGLLILSGVFNIDKNFASAMIVLFHILSAVFVLILGLISIFSLKLDLGEILKKAFNNR